MENKKLKIFYDYQILCGQKYGGVSRYYYDLICNIEDQKLAEPTIQCFCSRNKYFEEYFHKKSSEYHWTIGLIIQLINKLLTHKKLRRGYDIIHPTFYDPYVLKRKNGHVVVTVYDMIHELFPDLFSSHDHEAENKKKLLYQADHIIAISESTKRDILKLYPDIPADKISVIYIGSSFKYEEKIPEEISLPDKYVLFVGRRESYKNFERFFEAMKTLLDQDPKLHVLCIGGGAFNEKEKEQIGEYADRVMQLNANDSVLAYAYSHAQCFVFPSLYEGFGIPTLEAFTCNCPVVLSNTSSMPEVGGDAVVYFDPENTEDIEAGIKRVLDDQELRKQMKQKGRKQLEKFSWPEIAQQMVSCYQQVVEKK